MKKRFPSITLLVTTLKFTHEFLQNNLLQCKFFSQHLTCIKALTLIFSFLHHFTLQFLLWRGEIDLNITLHVNGHVYFLIGKQSKKSLFSKIIIQISDWGCSQCKLTQQLLLTLLGQQCWELLCPCWQWCAIGCNNVGTCRSIEGRMQPIRLIGDHA